MTQLEQRKSNKPNDSLEFGADRFGRYIGGVCRNISNQVKCYNWQAASGLIEMTRNTSSFFSSRNNLKRYGPPSKLVIGKNYVRRHSRWPRPKSPTVKKLPTIPTPKPGGHNGTAPAKNRRTTLARPGNNNNAGNRQATRGSKGDFVAASDYFKAVEYPALPIETIPPSRYEIIQDNMGLENAVDLLMREKIISVDTETSGLDPFDSKLLLIQVATTEMCYIIDATKFERLGPLKRLLEADHILKLLQNAKFDYKMIKAKFGIELCSIYDTYLAEKLLTAGTGSACRLDEIVQRRLQVTMDKSVRKSFIGQSHANMSPEQFEYAVKDVMVLFPIYNIQRKKLKEEKLMETADLEFRCVMAVGDLELSGCYLDQDKWREILKDVAQKRDAVRGELMGMLPNGNVSQPSLFGETFGGAEYAINLNSGQQIMAEFKQLGIELEDTSEATLSKHNHPAVKKLLEYRSHEKTLGSFGEGLLAPDSQPR